MLVVQLKERAVTTATKRPITYWCVPTSFLGAQVEEVMAEERRRLLACVLLACWQIPKEKTKVKNL
jgi:hypothetical protein